MALKPVEFIQALDLNQQELRNAVIQNLSVLPSSGSSVTGQVAYKTGSGAGYYYFDGSAWQLLASGAGASNATSGSPGLIQLAGDITGSATVPTILGARSAVAAASSAIGFTVAPTLTTQASETEVGTSLGLVLTMGTTTANNVTLVNVPTHTGTASAGATITAFAALNIAAQTGITNVTYSGNAYGLVVNNPGLTGPTNYAARFVGATQFTGTIDASSQAFIAATVGPASGQQHTLPAVTSDVVALVGATQTLTAKTLTSPTINAGAYSGTFSGNHTLSGQVTFSNGTAPIISATIGPSSGQQHVLPAVTSDTVALIAAAQTFTNKTLTSPTINAGVYSGTFSGNHTLSGDVTFTGTHPIISASIGPASGQQHTLPAVTSDTIALLAAAQTFTNKTLTAPVLGGTVTGTYTLGGTPSIAATALTGTIAGGVFPALTGDITTAGGTLATVAAATQTNITAITPTSLLSLGGSLSTANAPIGIALSPTLSGNGTTPVVTGTSVAPALTLTTTAGTASALRTVGAVVVPNSTTTTEISSIRVNSPTFTNATAAVITTLAGLYVDSETLGATTGITVTTAYGVLARAGTAGGSNYALAAASSSGTVNWKVDGGGVVTQASSLIIGSTTVLNGSGVLQAAAFPALTGDVTTSGGSLAATVVGSNGTFYVGSGGPKLKNSSGVLQVRNNADSTYADLAANNVTVNGNLTVVGDYIQSTGTIVKSTDVFALLNDGAASFSSNPAGLAYSSGQFTGGAGLIVERYNVSTTRQDVGLVWDETNLQIVHTVISGTTTNHRRTAAYYAVDCAASTATTVTHNFNNKYCIVQVFDETTFNAVYTDVQVTDANTVTVNFPSAPTAGQYKIVVVG